MLKRDKKSNISKVLHALWIHKNASRVQISRSIGLDKSTVTNIINEMIDIGLIRIVAEGDSGPQGGRKPVLLKINPVFGYVIGAEIQPELCRMVVSDLDGTISDFGEYRFDASADFKELFINGICPFVNKQQLSGKKILGLGVGLPGVVDPYRSMLMQSIPLGLSDNLQLPGFDEFAEITGGFTAPIIYENDANCCAWGELALGRSDGIRNFITILIEFTDAPHPGHKKHAIALGVGIVIDGKVYHGKNYSSGEFRSLFWKEGNRTQFSLSDVDVDLIKTDDSVQRRFVEELADHVAFLVNMFNLSFVFFGGDAVMFEKTLPQIVSDAIKKNWPYGNSVDCKISFLSQGKDAVSYGAASLVLNSIFVDYPIVSHEGMMLPAGTDFIY